MSTLKKFEEASLNHGRAIPLTKEEVQALYGLLDNLRGAIDIIVPDSYPSALTRQEAAHYKLALVESAKELGITWEEDECGVLHGPFMLSRAYKQKCALCGREVDQSEPDPEPELKKWDVEFAVLSSEPQTYDLMTVTVEAETEEEAQGLGESLIEDEIKKEWGSTHNCAGIHFWWAREHEEDEDGHEGSSEDQKESREAL